MLTGVHEEKRQFVEKMALLLKEAKPDVKDCVYSTPEIGEFVTVTMENDAQYKIDVTASSLPAIVLDVFKVMTHK